MSKLSILVFIYTSDQMFSRFLWMLLPHQSLSIDIFLRIDCWYSIKTQYSIYSVQQIEVIASIANSTCTHSSLCVSLEKGSLNWALDHVHEHNIFLYFYIQHLVYNIQHYPGYTKYVLPCRVGFCQLHQVALGWREFIGLNAKHTEMATLLRFTIGTRFKIESDATAKGSWAKIAIKRKL